MVTFLVITIDLDDFYHVMGAVNTLFLNKSAVVFFLTSFAGFCPLYAPFGIRTCKPKD